jgi:hypothetical protein
MNSIMDSMVDSRISKPKVPLAKPKVPLAIKNKA